MTRSGFGSPEVVGFGASSSQDDQSSAGFEELAMPLFDSFYNFACWLVDPSNDGEDRSYKRSISRLYAISNRYAAWTLANSHSFGTD
jgi:hypothetical protein